MNKKPNNQIPNKFAPEVEVRRNEYDQMAEALCVMINQIATLGPGVAEIEPSIRYVPKGDSLAASVINHLEAVWMNIELFDPRTVRRFYTEMRLFTDQMELEQRQASASIQ